MRRRARTAGAACLLVPLMIVTAAVAVPDGSGAAAPANEPGPAATVRASPLAGVQDRERAIELTDRAAELLGEQQLDAALELLEEAIAADETYWEAHYQKGRALALSDRMEEAKESLLRSTELNPGHAHAHRLASLAARNVGDMDTAWDQAIRAYLAGAEPGDAFGNLAQISEPPADIDTRINAARVFVAGIDAAEFLAGAEQPSNLRRGGATDTENARAVLNQSAAQLDDLGVRLRNAVSASPAFGLVLRAEQADYVLALSIDDLRARPPMQLDGYLRLYERDNPEPVYFRQISLRDINAAGSLTAELQRYVQQMAEWRLQQIR